MKDINIVIDSQTHKVQFPDNFLGLNAENLQGNINFTFTNGFVNGIARLELSIDCESGFIPNLQNTGDSYTLPILSSLLTSDNIVMQLVIEQTDLITYKLTTDTSINNQKTYYTRSGVEGEYVYTIVENPKVADIGTYYEAQIPIFKTHIFNMTVGESINAVNTLPDDYPTWIDTLNSLVGQVNAKIIEMNQALAKVDNLGITATKEGTTVTVTITRKDGSQQVVTITDGKDGVGIEKIEKTDTNLLVDTYTIYYTDDSTSTFQVKNGRGIVSIDKTNTNILTDTYTITYNDNTTSTFYVVNGNGVESIIKIGTSGLIDTYRISYTNGEYYDYQVANGNGIDNIQKTDTTGLVDTYTITYTNGTTSTYIITNGNGISNIAKTSTVDNVDTYTIYYTNGTTSTFTVTNSTVTNQEFQELQRLVDYNALYANALIKMNNTGTELTINDTANCPMPMSLSPSELEQETTTGKNLANTANFTKTNGNGIVTITSNKITVVFSGGTGSNYYTDLALDMGDITPFLGKNIAIQCHIKNNKTNTSGGSWNIRLRSGSDSDKPTVFQTGFEGITAGYDNVVSATGSVPNDATGNLYLYIMRYPSTSVDGYDIDFFEIQVEENSIVTPYEKYTGAIPSPNPNYPQDIHTISGDNEIKVGNKNFYKPFNYSRTNNGVSFNHNENGSIIANGTATANALSIASADATNYLITLFSGTYTISGAKSGCEIQVVSNIGSIISTDTGNSGNFTLLETTMVFIRLVVKNGTTVNNIAIYPMLEKGSSATPYTPHQEQSLPLNLGDLEYSKIGDYEDEFVYNTTDTSLELNKWYLKKNVGKVMLDGSEDESYTKSYGSIYNNKALYQLNNIQHNNTNYNLVISNRFKAIGGFTEHYSEGINVTKNTSFLGLILNADRVTEYTVEALHTFFQNNPTEVDYVLETPQYILLNDTLQSQLTEIYKWVKAYQEQTNISQVNNDLPFIINTITCYDLNKLLTRVEVLESEV